MKFSYSHIGLCVTDMERSLRFYCDGLGFEVVRELSIDSNNSTMDLNGRRLTAIYIAHGSLVLELWCYDPPNPPPSDEGGFERPGLSHLALEVDDVDEVRERILQFGGGSQDASRSDIARSDLEASASDGGERTQTTFSVLMCTDPDGNVVELIKSPGSAPKRLGDRMCWQV